MKVPKIYLYDEKNIVLKEISKRAKSIVLFLTLFFGAFLGLAIDRYLLIGEESRSPEYEELMVLMDAAENELMSPLAIYEYMKEVGIKYPEIVWSQIALETRFCSRMCKENNNYFGMKRATNRPNVQTGENLGHATYTTWKMSVVDYAMWQAAVGSYKFRSEEAYLSYLDQHYAEDRSYAIKVKEIRDNFNSYLKSYDTRFKKGELK